MNKAISIKFFGMLQEQIGSMIEVDESVENVEQLRAILEKKYIYLNGINYLVAVNKNIASNEIIITSDSEIAILPPFSGG
ncbi:MAG: MoaD/ThiS family protein [Bacteroidota bacterium]|nr:MoaD/ThiS family protein [Bacteroidota bacterium]